MLKIKAALPLGHPAGAGRTDRTTARRGSPLPHDVRQAAESLLDANLSGVRIHVSTVPARMLSLAFTHGDDIYFAPSRYDPGTPEGLRLLGHELAHVVQQRQGRAYNPHGYGVALVRDPALEDEAERTGLALQTMMKKGKAEEPYLALEILKWNQFWVGNSNNKYPPITVLNLGEFSQLQKLGLIRSILDQRRDICRFNLQPNVYSEGAQHALQHAGGDPAIFIPSSGKTAEWLWKPNKTQTGLQWWWIRMAQIGVRVFLVVSQDEFGNYADALRGHEGVSLYIVGYDGFGIGCGRAACVRMIVDHQLIGVITDDRTSAVDWTPIIGGESCPVNQRDEFLGMLDLSNKKYFCSVMPFGKCTVMTIVRGDKTIPKTDGMYCFPSLLMSSKEDLSLFAVMNTVNSQFCEINNIYQINVHTDTNNPPYTNNPVSYTGRKAAVLAGCCASTFFRDAAGRPMDAQGWQKYDFLNMWDVIKMQESALYQLIASLGEIEPKSDAVAPFREIVNHYFFARR